jgi:DNA replication protein DnaC
MNNEAFIGTRLQDAALLDKVLEMKKRLVNNKCKCEGSGFIRGGKYCQCMYEFMDAKAVLVSGAPLEALDVREIVKDGRKLEDPACKRVVLSVNQHEIYDVNRKKSLYKDIIKPYLYNAERGAFGNGDSLMIFGGNSRGKTWALYFILIWLTHKMSDKSVLFFNLKDLFTIINDAYYGATNTVEGAENRGRAINMLQLIRDVDMLLIDEGSKLPKFSDHVAVQLEGTVKDRIGNKKPIVLCTNHTPEDFYRLFGPSVVSAFIKNVLPLHIMDGLDMRTAFMAHNNAFGYIKG